MINEGIFSTRDMKIHERDQGILITLPPLGVCFLELIEER